jgi:hypothetical protein
MSDSISPESYPADRSWLSQGITAPQVEGQERFLGWWHNWTAIPEPPTNASFARRDAARRGRLFSTVGFFFLIVLLLFFPACAFLPNHLVIYLDGLLIGITVGTLLLNRVGKTLAAGIILVVASELVLTAVIFTTTPFDETSIQLYDLYVIVDLLAVSLLPPQYIFGLALCNSLLMWGSLSYQPHTAVLTHDLLTQFIPVLVRPVGLQIIIAGVAYIWVRSATRAIMRAERAEMVATLEHMMVEERESFIQANRQLEASIQQLVRTHAESMNGQTIAKIPYPADARILWPLVGVINSLWMRLQRAHHTEYELQQLKQAIAAYAEVLHRAAITPQQPVPIYHTRTDLDSLIFAVGNLQRTPRVRE